MDSSTASDMPVRRSAMGIGVNAKQQACRLAEALHAETAMVIDGSHLATGAEGQRVSIGALVRIESLMERQNELLTQLVGALATPAQPARKV